MAPGTILVICSLPLTRVAAVTKALDRTPGVAVEHVGLNEPAVVRLSDGADREAVRGAVEGAGFRPVFAA